MSSVVCRDASILWQNGCTVSLIAKFDGVLLIIKFSLNVAESLSSLYAEFDDEIRRDPLD